MAGRRPYMEDRIVFENNSDFELYAVLDGHSGNNTVDFLSQNLVDISREYIEKLKPALSSLTIEFIFRELFRTLHIAVLANTDFHNDFSGSTLTLGIKKQDVLYIANIGDTSAFIINDNDTSALTCDHLPDDTLESQRIVSSGGFIKFRGVWRVVGQLAISRSFGDHHLRQYLSFEPFVKVLPLRTSESSTLVIGSDGLWESLSPLDVSKILRNKTISSKLASDIVYKAYVRGSLDNIAVLIVEL